MEKAKQIYKWIGKRYKKYDEFNGEYSGDKYSKIIFCEAANEFSLDEGEVDRMYNFYVSDMMDELTNFSKALGERATSPILERATRLHNKQIKLNLKALLNQKHKRRRNFVEFVNANIDMVFRAVSDNVEPHMYKLKGNEDWVFALNELFEYEFSTGATSDTVENKGK